MIRPEADVLVVGGGITGMAAAVFLRRLDPSLVVLVVDRALGGSGASTRNAGFACMGSLGELLADDVAMGRAAAVSLYRRRWEGLQLLEELVPAAAMDLSWCGGSELFFEEQAEEWERVRSSLAGWNADIRSAAGIACAFEADAGADWGGWRPGGACVGSVRHLVEGRLHPGKMLRALVDLARRESVRMQSGVELRRLEESASGVRAVDSYGREWRGSRVLVATNAFTPQLLPEVAVVPARNQVLLTEDLRVDFPDKCFHVNQGYIYFRRYGNRMLIGGARHLDPEGETTDQLGDHAGLQTFLLDFAEQRLLGYRPAVAHRWSGIIGVGPGKLPIVEKLSERIAVAVRLSGMGVALGSAIGRDGARLILDHV